MKITLLMLLATSAALAQKITFYKDVVPVLQSRCQGCHRPGEAAPMSFLTYSSTRPWAKAIRQAVMLHRMPPWFAESTHGQFANDPSLTRAEIDTLVGWADSGAGEGNPADAPPPLNFVEGWNIGKPDMVFEMPEPFPIPSLGAVEYQHIIIPTGFREDKWIKAVEIRPGNRAVVHHVVALVRPPGSRWFKGAVPGVPVTRMGFIADLPVQETPEFLLSYTPGRPPVGLPDGQARLIKAGSDLVLQLHYTPNGKATQDRTKVGIIFASEPPRERVATLLIDNRTFVIPPGSPDHRVDTSVRVVQPARLIRVIPHMHLRGKAFEMRLTSGAGEGETLLRVPRYDFQWQNAYYLKKPIALIPGAKIECFAWFDNSPNNPSNPDPKAEVRWGDQSWEEMMVAYVDVAVPADAEPKNVLTRPTPGSQRRPADQ